MAFEKRNNSGYLFKNDRKEKDTHPNMTGYLVIDGVEYFIDAWTKENERGKYQSLSVKRKEKQGDSSSVPASNTPPTDEFDDDIPF